MESSADLRQTKKSFLSEVRNMDEPDFTAELLANQLPCKVSTSKDVSNMHNEKKKNEQKV